MTTGTVFDIKKFSIHDGPGIRTTVFLSGCPLRCWWCHNPESQTLAPKFVFRENRCIACDVCLEVCPEDAISRPNGKLLRNADLCTLCGTCINVCYPEAREIVGLEMSVAEVMSEIKKDIVFFDESGGGVTFSGGEPLVQHEFLLELLKACKTIELHTAVDTSGFAKWELFEKILPFTDLFLFDLKHMDDEKHREYTAVGNERILENLVKLDKAGAQNFVRIPIIPSVNDDDNQIKKMSDFLSSLQNVKRVDILPYHKIATDKYTQFNEEYKLNEMEPPSQEHMAGIQKFLQERGFEVHIGG